MYAAPAPIPPNPYGAKLCQSEPQFDACTYRLPSARTNSTTETLMTTMVELNRALSLMPIARIAVITSAITNAGRLNPISIPKIRGALTKSWGRCTSSGDCAPINALTLSRKACVPGTSEESEACAICRATIFSAVSRAVQWSYASQSGILMWKMSSSSIKWFDQPEETVLAPMAYSSVKSQPIIHANSSPSVAYA